MKFNLAVIILSQTSADADNSHSLPAHLPLPPHLRKSPSPSSAASLPVNMPVPHHLRNETMDVIITDDDVATTEPPSLLAALLGDYNDAVEEEAEEEVQDEPKRGAFDLQLALRDSRDRGYGNGVRLRFNGVSKSSLDPIYLCSARPADQQCCTNKDPHCFTPGGCFCDASCKAFDDCCPDYVDLCVDRSCLEKKGSDPVQTYFRSMRLGAPKNSTENRLPSGGGSPGHVEPDACCGGKPYNHEERCCCNEQITDQCPCQAN